MNHRIAIIGGGISGLAAAHRLRELDPEVEILILESSDRLGGVIQTRRQLGCLIESAADNFLTDPPAAIELCKRLGLTEKLIGESLMGRESTPLPTSVFHPLSDGIAVRPAEAADSSASRKIGHSLAKIRHVFENLFNKSTFHESDSRESLASLFGKHKFEHLIQPLVYGPLTIDGSIDSKKSTANSQFHFMEHEHGGFIKAISNQQGLLPSVAGQPSSDSVVAQYGPFATLAGGMSTLIEAMEQRLPPGSVHLNSPACRLERSPAGNWVIFTAGENAKRFKVDGVIIAAPAHHAAKILTNLDEEIVEQLKGIEYTNCSIVTLAYTRVQIGHPLDAVGILVPLDDHQGVLSCSFSNLKYEGRAPEGVVLLQSYLGGTSQCRLLQESDELLLAFVKSKLTKLLKLSGDPILENVTNRAQPMPQYHTGHRERMAVIDQRLERYPTLALAGSAFHGVGVPVCVKSGEDAAARILAGLHRSQTSDERPDTAQK